MITMHDFREALALSLEKLNNIRSRITGKAPVDWTKFDNVKRRKPSRKLKKGYRKARGEIIFKVGDKVRHLLKAAEQLNKFYKSYRSLEETAKHSNWSKTVYVIQKKRTGAGISSYFLNGKWYKGYQLQKVDGVLKLNPQEARPEKVPKQRKKAIQKIAKPPKYRKVKTLQIDMLGWGQPVRGKRKRKKVNYKV